MPSDLALYIPAGTFAASQNPFGRTIANRELYRALALHGGFGKLDFITQDDATLETLRSSLSLPENSPSHLGVARRGSQAAVEAASAGVLMRGDPDLYDLAWERRTRAGDEAYSLVGLIHTLAPPEMRKRISMSSVAPVRPWDAVICTSPSVRDATSQMFDNWADYLSDRMAGSPPPRPMLPVIPLGVDRRRMETVANRPAARAALRAELGLADEDILVLWVGRLSFFEKAYPQPMFRAIEEAAQSTGARVHFAMAGWFPSGAADRDAYREAAEAYAPSVRVSFENGNSADRVADLWAATDIFISLVDNVQETFGLTPVEAMAAGLPVVVSDWDGYRYTVRDGQEGFLIPTLGGPQDGLGEQLARPHLAHVESYQSYVGTVAQFTAVNVGRAAAALADLIRSPDLRRRMGAAGRARVASAFDWPVVIGEIRALLAELAQIRSAAQPEPDRRALNPVAVDPFRDFAGFASQVLNPDTRLFVRPGVTAGDLVRANNVQLDRKASVRRAPLAQTVHAFGMIERGEAHTVAEVLARFPAPLGDPLRLSLLWMCKLGILDWLD